MIEVLRAARAAARRGPAACWNRPWLHRSAPRGSLYHCYELDDEGRVVVSARIVPPTSQNQSRIEDDLRSFAGRIAHESDADMTWLCEQAVRNYDPCISCATHFLTLTVDRE